MADWTRFFNLQKRLNVNLLLFHANDIATAGAETTFLRQTGACKEPGQCTSQRRPGHSRRLPGRFGWQGRFSWEKRRLSSLLVHRLSLLLPERGAGTSGSTFPSCPASATALIARRRNEGGINGAGQGTIPRLCYRSSFCRVWLETESLSGTTLWKLRLGPRLSEIREHMGSAGILARGAKCELLGPFAILVQSSLGALAILSLIYKRHIESPRRPVTIWFFDVSKQLFGAVVVHFLNIFMSTDSDVFVLRQKTSPCTWYFLNVLLDTTIGVGLIWILLRTLASICELFDLVGTKSGVYGSPPRWTWWLKQSLVYTIGLTLMKLAVFVILTTIPQLSIVGDFLLKWSEHHEKSRIFFVMFFFVCLPVVPSETRFADRDSHWS